MIRLVLIWLALLLPVQACPFCNPGESDIFGDVSAARAVAIVSKVDTRKYKILKSLKGNVKVGRVVVAGEPQGKLGKKGELLLTTAGPPNLPYWSDPPRVLTESELRFANLALELSTQPSSKQWDFAAKYLGSSSAEVSRAAYNLLAAAPLKEVQSRAHIVGLDKLIRWVQNPKLAPERRALFLLMCYQKLGRGHIPWIHDRLFASDLSPSSPLLGPLAVAYLHEAGPPAVSAVEKHFYKPEYPASRVTQLNRALTLVAEQAPHLKETIAALFRRELKHPNRGAFVLAPLGMWQDLSSRDDAEKLFQENSKITWVKVAVIRFFRSLPKADGKAYLDRLAKLDPGLVKRTTDGYRRSDLGID